MKDNDLVSICFTYNKAKYIAMVFKHSPTAIVLPDGTILKTTCIVLTNTKGRNADKKHTRSIFDGEGNLLELQLYHRPGNSTLPTYCRFPLVFANYA